MLDYHTHTSFSDDCSFSMEEMILTAIEYGLNEYAITDHYDPCYPMDRFGYTFDLDCTNYLKELERCKDKYSDRIKIVKGIELGLQLGDALPKCIECTKYPFDIIIGSFHLIDYEDICLPFHNERTPLKADYDYYSYMLETIKEFHDFDILGHINAIDRYTAYIPDYSRYMDLIREILEILVKNNIGIEINTSSYRYNMGTTTIPSRDILKLYREIGGKIITFGSDSHNPADISYNYNMSMEYLKSLGYTKIAVFDNRRYKMIKI